MVKNCVSYVRNCNMWLSVLQWCVYCLCHILCIHHVAVCFSAV